jgi:hypothetical protein
MVTWLEKNRSILKSKRERNVNILTWLGQINVNHQCIQSLLVIELNIGLLSIVTVDLFLPFVAILTM